MRKLFYDNPNLPVSGRRRRRSREALSADRPVAGDDDAFDGEGEEGDGEARGERQPRRVLHRRGGTGTERTQLTALS